MNPFRKKSTAPVLKTPVVDVPPDLWGDIIDPAPVASPEAVEGGNPWIDVPPSTSSPPPSVVLSPARPTSTTASVPSSVAVPTPATSPPQPKVAPRSPPPPVAPRRRSQIQRRAPVPEPEPVEPSIDDPFNTDTSEPETPPLNPFNRSFSEPAEPAVPKQRQSLDVDAFKRLMLTGYADTPPAATTKDGSSTSESSGSRLSIFEPILESKSGETPRSSEEVDVEGRRKPPPPRPRRVSPPFGRSASIRLSVPPPPPPPAPTLTSPNTSSTIGPVSPIVRAPSSPPQTSPPASPATSLKKRMIPSPPLSRRQSMRSSVELERPSTPSGGSGKVKPPPPPPPVRRMKSTNRGTHERTPSIGNMPPPPPPPPPPRGRTVSGSTIEEKVPEEKDILIDLQKLQREVDELRGKYEQGIVTVE